jgi:hypothetical protein
MLRGLRLIQSSSSRFCSPTYFCCLILIVLSLSLSLSLVFPASGRILVLCCLLGSVAFGVTLVPDGCEIGIGALILKFQRCWNWCFGSVYKKKYPVLMLWLASMKHPKGVWLCPHWVGGSV